MRDTNDSWLQSGGQQAWLSLKKMEEEVPRFALLEEAIEDLIGKQENIGTRAKTDRDVSLLKKTSFQRKVDLSEVKIVSPA